jgi:serine protease Do
MPGDERQAARESGDNGSDAPKVKLGLGLASLTPDLAERVGVGARTKGAVITSVRDGSPAQEAGLKEGDVVIEVDRKLVSTAGEASKLLRANRAGGHLLRVQRGPAALFIVLPTA